MKKFAKNFDKRWLNVILGALLLVAAVAVIIIACVNPSGIETAASIILGVCLFLTGALAFTLAFLSEGERQFYFCVLYGSSVVALGVVFCANSNIFTQIVQYFIGVFLIALGACALIKAIIYIVKKLPVKNIVLYFIAMAILLGLGITMVCLKGDTAKTVIYIILGVSIAVSGLGLLVVNAVSLNHDRKEKKAEKKLEKAKNIVKEAEEKEQVKAEVKEENKDEEKAE